LNNILFPYITRVRTTSNLDASNSALVIYDTFRGQCTERILGLLEDNNAYVAIVPANCTVRLQPLDLSVNKAAKKFLRREFKSWCSDQICDQLCKGIKPAKSVDLRLSIGKPLGAQWMIRLYDYFKSKPDIAKNGFKEAGITFYKKLIE